MFLVYSRLTPFCAVRVRVDGQRVDVRAVKRVSREEFILRCSTGVCAFKDRSTGSDQEGLRLLVLTLKVSPVVIDLVTNGSLCSGEIVNKANV
jgi:hypothetical protein